MPSTGTTPVLSLQLGPHALDGEFTAQLRPALGKTILDPRQVLSDVQRDDLGRLLDSHFGTPFAATVRLPTRSDAEKLALLDELLDNVTVHPDRIVVSIHGAPPLNVAFAERGSDRNGDRAAPGRSVPLGDSGLGQPLRCANRDGGATPGRRYAVTAGGDSRPCEL